MAKDFQMPIVNQAAADRAQAAQTIALQNALRGGVSGVGPSPSAAVPAEALAVDATTAQGNIAASGAAAEAQRVAEQQALAFEQQKRQQASQDIRDKEILESRRMNQEAEFNKLGRDVKEKVLDSRRRFDERAGESRLTNLQQLSDFARLQAIDDERFRTYEQTVQNATKLQIKALEDAYKLFEQEERQMVASGMAQKDRETFERVRARKRQAAEAIANSRKKQGWTQTVVGAAKVGVGTVAMVYTGGTAAPWAAPLMVSGAQDIQQGNAKQNEQTNYGSSGSVDYGN